MFKIAVIRNVKTPIRSTQLSAGIDFYIPEFDSDFLKELGALNNYSNFKLSEIRINKFIDLAPLESILIPSGIKISLPQNTCGLFVDRSSKGAQGLILGAKLIDEDYQGEVKLSLINASKNIIRIFEGEKITQMIIVPTLYYNIKVVPEDKLYINKTERGQNGFGSTGN